MELTIKAVVSRLTAAREEYYNPSGNSTGTMVMGDAEFDSLEDWLQEHDPKNSYFTLVGAISTGKKVYHEVPMYSAAKAKTVEDVADWLKRVGAEGTSLLIEPKIDGLSAKLVYRNKVPHLAATRGDGTVGQDISHVLPYLNIPQRLSTPLVAESDIEIRGEIYLPKDTTLPNPENKPLRNLAAGLIGRRDNQEDLKHLRFVAYKTPGRGDLQDLLSIGGLGFSIVKHTMVTNLSDAEKAYEIYLATLRAQWEYETDGLMLIINNSQLWPEINSKYVVTHHEHHTLAWKPLSEAVNTTLVSITSQVSRSGNLIPVANITPVIIGGRKVSRASLSSWSTVFRMGLQANTNVCMEVSNDVIPYLSTNLDNGIKQRELTKDSPELYSNLTPVVCPSCGSTLIRDGVHLKCANQSRCPAQQLYQILHWCETTGMEFFSEASVRLLLDSGLIHGIPDLYLLVPSTLASLPGFGAAKVANAMAQIEKSKELSIATFCSALIDGVGRKSVNQLNIHSFSDLLSFDDKQYVIGQRIQQYVAANREFLIGLEKHLRITVPKARTVTSRNVCMTGTGHKGRKELQAEIESKGDAYAPSVTKDTHILVCEDPNAETTKLQKARKAGVKLMSYQEYFNV